MIGTPSRAALVVASAVLVAAAPPPDIAKAVYLTDVNPAAKCLDGSPGKSQATSTQDSLQPSTSRAVGCRSGQGLQIGYAWRCARAM